MLFAYCFLHSIIDLLAPQALGEDLALRVYQQDFRYADDGVVIQDGVAVVGLEHQMIPWGAVFLYGLDPT